MSMKQQLTEDMKAAMKAGEAQAGRDPPDQRCHQAARSGRAHRAGRHRRDRRARQDGQAAQGLGQPVRSRQPRRPAEIERAEIVVIEAYLPAKMGEAEIVAAIQAAIAETGAAGPADMGKLMGALKPKLAGQADMGLVSKLVKQQLA
jgi:hypothetical protein